MVRRALNLAGACALGAIMFSACTTSKNVLGTTASPCFRSLVVAKHAVPAGSRFAGVRSVSEAAFRADLAAAHVAVELPAAIRSVHQPICVVAYVGHFEVEQVSKGWSPTNRPGRIAVVIVGATKNRLLATIVLTKAPLRLSRVFPLTS